MMRPIVLLTDNDLGDRSLETGWLRDALDAEVVVADCRTTEQVREQIERHRPAAIVTQWAPIDAAAIAAAEDCRVISRIGIGVDMIDLTAAREAGIPVRNVPHYCTEEVATHAVAMALALWRRLPQLDAEVRAGTWAAATHAPHIGRLSEATLGLIGCGRIGTLVGRAFEAWGAKVIVVDPAPANDPWARVELNQLAEEADIISLHAPLLPQTHHVVDTELLWSMPRRPVLVNTSRGGLVDLAAAVEAVTEGRLRGLGLDVFEEEPIAGDHPVRMAPNTLLGPHAAWCSQQALPDLRRGAIDNVIEALGGAR
ncbi:C-terminal binding protein [Microbacterium sp. NIBRBAC000506063]|uniref:C-terminal binding protein n=1 Tax=Microbacterium sp. NIBRBAC000506063 TaxID=2734618 RepID=UPI001BB4B578|nr:C-terminal binding protein [Microbacterium sp. NIBRBAC000506063]QTV79324.1 C-terminal binding protein [Microbacterium sp. NIBRBAC000506063]